MTLDASGFLERFAMLMPESGYPRMAARVFAALLVSDDGSLTAAELADRLQVGPSAISGAVKYLMRIGMVSRKRDPGERRDRYRVDQMAWFTAAMARCRRMGCGGFSCAVWAWASASWPDTGRSSCRKAPGMAGPTGSRRGAGCHRAARVFPTTVAARSASSAEMSR
ncbi:GbsR/MarR family transcriptional regulator [Nonomuraea helvata]|uniref:GbsR/MarR family transcriptional regulator n=1 Tax=Nonomuraea helvata TaxID=37484 RepID=A0ABV5S8V2_9ACTN